MPRCVSRCLCTVVDSVVAGSCTRQHYIQSYISVILEVPGLIISLSVIGEDVFLSKLFYLSLTLFHRSCLFDNVNMDKAALSSLFGECCSFGLLPYRCRMYVLFVSCIMYIRCCVVASSIYFERCLHCKSIVSLSSLVRQSLCAGRCPHVCCSF